MKNRIHIYILLFAVAIFTDCKNSSSTVQEEEVAAVGPAFVADSAYVYCKKQCDFGPRVMNSKAHDDCRDWIVSEFQRHGCTVELQQSSLKGYDGTMLSSSNIIARFTPKAYKDKADTKRILLCAHYDSRPWADNDPDEKNHHTPVMAANDGASGIAVMLEIARLITKADSLKVGIDFVCFDAEDYGTPQWYEGESQVEDPWALGAQYWAQQMAANTEAVRPNFGILLDMVGGEGAKFYQEGMSLDLAREVVNYVWQAANVAGQASFFPTSPGGYITDDHIPVNQVAGIPCVDIIPYYPDCQQSNFGPTWHTINDTMDHISKSTLEAVGQTVIQVLYSLPE